MWARFWQLSREVLSILQLIIKEIQHILFKLKIKIKKNSRKLKGAEDWGDELPEIIFPEILINIFLKIPGQHPVFFFF